MKRRLSYSVAAVALLALGAAACSSSSSTSSGGSTSGNSSMGKTLTIVTTPFSPMTDNFNPYAQTGTGYQAHAEDLYYLPLMVWNTTNPTEKPIPALATSYSWSPDGKTLTLNLRSGVKWSDGQPVTGADVAFTFNEFKKFPALNTPATPVPVSTTSTATSATLTFAQPELANLFFILKTQIVSQHKWQSVANPVTYNDPNPVGDGPYELDKFSPQGFTLKINPDYYDKASLHVPEISFPAYASNADLLPPVASGQIDWAGISISGAQANYLGKSPNNTTFTSSAPYFSDNNVVGLWFNVTHKPLDDPKVRQAISYAINRQQLSTTAESDNEPVVTSTAGMLLPVMQSFLPSSLQNNLAATGDTQKAAQILTQDGYTKTGGFWQKNGQKISFAIEDPVNYGDYYLSSKLIAQQLTSFGINATIKGDPGTNGPTIWTNDLNNGTFDAAIHWGAQGLTPFFTYDNWMDSKYTAPVGKVASADYGRFNDPQAQTALAAYAGASTQQQLSAAVSQLATIQDEQVPVAPLMLGASWAEFSTRNYTGWPSQSNSYMDAGPNPPEILYTVSQLKPVSG